MKIVVLASIGQHPHSKRARVAPAEARALALARQVPGAEIIVLHAGSRESALPVLQEMLGMGATTLRVLDLPAEADPLPALDAALAALRPGLVLCGAQAEAGEGGGHVPYLLAAALGWPLAPAATALVVRDNIAEITLAAPGGRRRQVAAQLPAVVTLDHTGPAPRLAALGPMRRGQIDIVSADGPRDDRLDWSVRPARPRPKRLSGPPTGATELAGKSVHRDLDAEAAARLILNYLQQEGLARPAGSTNRVN